MHKNQSAAQAQTRKRKHVAGIEGSCADKEICAKEVSCIEEGIGARDVTCVEKGNCTEGRCCRVK